jgi:hypothetical protein
MGGLPNLWKQHNPGNSKTCQLALKKKNKQEETQRSQPSLQSYFTERPKDLVPPTVPILRHVIANVIDPSSSVPNLAAPSSKPDTSIVTLLADLEKAISDLPSTHPDPINVVDLSKFPPILPTNVNREDAWIFILDPHLNRFLGFGKSIESIAASIKGQKSDLVSLVNFLRYYNDRFGIDAAPIEGKVRRLIRAIDML